MKIKSNIFSLSRFFKLLQHDFNNNRLYYLAIIPVAMLAIGLVHWFNYPDAGLPQINYSYRPWESKRYLPTFILGYIVFGIIIGGNSFPGLKNNNSTIRYLSLPASVFEKFLFQWGTRILLFLILYPLIFKLTVNFTADIYLDHLASILVSEGKSLDLLPKIDYLIYSEYFGKNSEPILLLFLFLLMGIGGISLMFLGGTIFRKWNILLGPITILFLVFVFFLHLVILSHFLVPESTEGWEINFKIGGPEIIKDLPLPILSGFVFLGLLSIVSWVVAYLRLKEREA